MRQITVVGYVCITTTTIVTTLGSSLARLGVTLAASHCIFIPAVHQDANNRDSETIEKDLQDTLKHVSLPLLHYSHPSVKPLFKF